MINPVLFGACNAPDQHQYYLHVVSDGSNPCRNYCASRLCVHLVVSHGDPAGSRDVVGGIKEGWKVGEMHGAFEVISSLDRAHERAAQAEINVTLWTAGTLAVLGAIAWMLLRSGIITPLERIRGFASSVAAGDLNARPDGQFHAEFSEVGEAIETMVDNLKMKMNEADMASGSAKMGVSSGTMCCRASRASANHLPRSRPRCTHSGCGRPSACLKAKRVPAAQRP